VIVEHYLAKRSRNNCQNNCHKSQKHVLYQILQKTFLNRVFATLEHSLTVLTLVTVVT